MQPRQDYTAYRRFMILAYGLVVVVLIGVMLLFTAPFWLAGVSVLFLFIGAYIFFSVTQYWQRQSEFLCAENQRLLQENRELEELRETLASAQREFKRQQAALMNMMQDIVESKDRAEDMQRALRDKTRALTISNQDLEQFALMVAHDMQAPARTMMMIVHRFEEKCQTRLDENGKRYLNWLKSASKRMSDLIISLFQYSKAATTPPKMQWVNLNSLLKGVLIDLKAPIEESRAEVHAAELPSLVADPIQIHQLFLNIVSNGIKYRRPDVPPQIHVAGRRTEDGKIEIVFRDNGIGFEMEYVDQIFQPFKRLHRNEEFEGTGMGLAICGKIVSRYGGTIEAESRLGEGSQFTIHLPENPISPQ